MSIIKKAIKVGTPLAVAYLSVEPLRIWSRQSHQEIDNKLAFVCNYEKKALDFVVDKTNLDTKSIKQWVPDFSGDLGLTRVWNKAVKTTFRTINDIDLKETSKKLYKMMTTEAPKKS